MLVFGSNGIQDVDTVYNTAIIYPMVGCVSQISAVKLGMQSADGHLRR